MLTKWIIEGVLTWAERRDAHDGECMADGMPEVSCVGRNAAKNRPGKGLDSFKGLINNWKWSDSRRIEWVEYVGRDVGM